MNSSLPETSGFLAPHPNLPPFTHRPFIFGRDCLPCPCLLSPPPSPSSSPPAWSRGFQGSSTEWKHHASSWKTVEWGRCSSLRSAQVSPVQWGTLWGGLQRSARKQRFPLSLLSVEHGFDLKALSGKREVSLLADQSQPRELVQSHFMRGRTADTT